jgi:alpha-beta hydrolase superfamily lysophospholipase
VPSQPIDVVKRSSRWAAQRWLLDAVIGLVGPEWDQGRLAYYAAACGQDSQVDFTAVRPHIRKYDDLAREFSKAARRRELLARDAERREHPTSARESYFTAAVLYGAAQWAIETNTEFNLLLDRKKTECYSAFVARAGRIIHRLEIPFRGREVPAYLHLPAGAEPGTLPCVVSVPGMDAFKEMSVAMDGDRLLNRGFAVLAIDTPGQGESLTRGVWYDPDTYGELRPAVYDAVAEREELDSDRIFLFGRSFGSFLATQLAATESRFAACAVVMTCFEAGGFSLLKTSSPTFKLRFTYMTGANTEEEVDRVAQRLTTDGLSQNITRPYLIVAGEDDNLSDIGSTYRHLNEVKAPKTLIIYEGANHGIHAASSGVLGPEPISTASDWLYDRAMGVALESSHNVVDASGNVTSKPWTDTVDYAYVTQQRPAPCAP